MLSSGQSYSAGIHCTCTNMVTIVIIDVVFITYNYLTALIFYHKHVLFARFCNSYLMLFLQKAIYLAIINRINLLMIQHALVMTGNVITTNVNNRLSCRSWRNQKVYVAIGIESQNRARTSSYTYTCMYIQYTKQCTFNWNSIL